jgi:hypothetical protein
MTRQRPPRTRPSYRRRERRAQRQRRKGSRSPDEIAVRQRAEFDLRCEDSKLRLVAMDARTIGADGCGRRAVYTNTCTERDRDNPTAACTWVQTSTSTGDPVVK